MSKRKRTSKRTSYSLEFKFQLLAELDEKKLSKSEICWKHGIPNSSLSTIIATRKQLETVRNESRFRPGTKRMKTSNQDGMESALFIWFKQARTLDIPVSGPILMEKATELSTAMGIDFKANTGWLERFKQRKGFTLPVISRQAALASRDDAESWAAGVPQSMLGKYLPANIFNADETGLFFQCLPNKTLAMTDEACAGGKKSENRLSILLAANMDGSEKLPPLVIGKSQKPRAFKNVKTLPLEYRANKKAWMTADFFEEWLRKLDRKLATQNRQVAMVVDKCTAHPKVKDLQAIKLIFIPPNTNILQPCAQGIIQNFKMMYRKIVVRKLILHIEDQMKGRKTDTDFGINILDALYYTKEAWAQVTQTTIAQCFRHAGFMQRDSPVMSESTESPEEPDNYMYSHLFERLKDLIPLEITADAYLAVDETLSTSEILTTADIVAAVMDKEVEEEGEDDEVDPPAPPTVADARDALTILRQFLENQTGSEKQLDIVSSLGEFVENVPFMKSGQTSIKDFFKKD